MPIKTKKKFLAFRNTFIRGPPYNAYKNTRKNKLNEINKRQELKKRQNRASEIRLPGVPPIMPIKTPEKKSQNRDSEIPQMMTSV